MIILITKSEIFTTDPDIRFSRINGAPVGLWREMWRRHKILEYTFREMAEYYELKTKKQISRQNIKRWVLRTEIYSKTKPVIDKGCQSLNSEFFGDIEWFVIKEITKNLKSSVNKNIKVLP